MKSCREDYIIVEKDKFRYVVYDERGKTYEIFLTFYDIEAPDAGDTLNFSSRLLDIGFTEGVCHFHFGGLDEVYGRVIDKADLDTSDEVLVIKSAGGKVYLKRFYG